MPSFSTGHAALTIKNFVPASDQAAIFTTYIDLVAHLKGILLCGVVQIFLIIVFDVSKPCRAGDEHQRTRQAGSQEETVPSAFLIQESAIARNEMVAEVCGLYIHVPHAHAGSG